MVVGNWTWLHIHLGIICQSDMYECEKGEPFYTVLPIGC